MALQQADLYNFEVETIEGRETTLEQYAGKVLLIVNVASKCGLTPQYTALESIYEQYHDQGFEVLGFPANDFGAQEPGNNLQIKTFCTANYSVKFPLFSKISVKGSMQHPLYRYLTDVKPVADEREGSQFKQNLVLDGYVSGFSEADKEISWNFEKFLINRHGEVVGRFAPDVEPSDPMVLNAIKAELAR